MKNDELLWPKETIILPSRGKYYQSGHPLRENGGKLDIKYMTAKEEDILTNTNLIQNQTVVDKLLESLIIHEGVKHTDLTLGDLEATLVASRVLAYGKDYLVEIQCNKCNEPVKQNIDLTQLDVPEEKDLIDVDEKGYHTFITETGKKISIKVMTRGDELEIEKNKKSIEKQFGKASSSEVTSRLKKIIVSIDGVTDKNELFKMIDNLLTKDTKDIRKEFEKINPSIDMKMKVTCPSCGFVTEGDIPIGINFLWPDASL